MLCQNCRKNEATVLYEENINGRKKSCRLCADCAAEKGIGIAGFGREMLNFGSGLFSGLFDAAAGTMMPMLGGMERGRPVRAEEQKRCPVCGSTLADITRNGRLGCGECYSVFGGMPLPRPKKNASEEERSEDGAQDKAQLSDADRQELELKLREAVAAENYEEAARLRDILRGAK